MTDEQIIDWIRIRLAPVEVRDWYLASLHEIKDAVITFARVHGTAEALKEVKNLYLSWLQMGATK